MIRRPLAPRRNRWRNEYLRGGVLASWQRPPIT